MTQEKLTHVGSYIPEPLARKMRIGAAILGISKAKYIKLAIKHLSNFEEAELKVIYETERQKEIHQNDHAGSS